MLVEQLLQHDNYFYIELHRIRCNSIWK